MNLPSLPTRIAASSQPRSEANTRLHGGILILTRTLWVALVALSIGIFIVSIPTYAAYLHVLCRTAACNSDQLTRDGLQKLQSLGLSIDFYTAFSIARAIVFAFVYFVVGGVIFWHKSDDWMALFASCSLITFVVAFHSTMIATLPAAWWLPIQIVQLLSNAALSIFFYLFPDGRFVPRWTRWLAVGACMYWGAIIFFPNSPFNPFVHFPLLSIMIFLVLVGSIVFVQIYRYRRVSSLVQRQQTKWVVYGMSVSLGGFLGLLLFFALIFPTGPFSELIPFTVVYLLLLLIPLSIGFAILRYRLWDIDLVINRTLVYGALTLSIVGVYIVIVGTLSTLLAIQENLLISLFTTGLVAVLFQPLRLRLQRLVDRLMYGERDDPYKVISRLGKRLEVTLDPDTVLPTIVETVASALKLPYAAIALQQNDTSVITAAYGSWKHELVRLPLIYQTEQVGELILAPRTPNESFTPADHRLLDDLARQAGIAAHAVRLTMDLKSLTLDLQHSRERLVSAREEERRRLRRDLHDGLGPTLGHLTLQLDGVHDLILQDPPAAQALTSQLKTHVQIAMDDIRRLVYDLRPPALDELGLVAAIREQASHYTNAHGLTVIIEANDALPLLPAAVEVAAYRIVLEALTNVVRHARAQTCRIILTVSDELLLEIRDDGCGLPHSPKGGVGLTSMRERAAEVGGICRIEALPEKGMHVLARLPLLKE